jgi:serine/threonine-protein kinase
MEELREDLETGRSGGVPKAVPEMMARSGGFNVPQDYFKPRPSSPMTHAPSSPPPSSRSHRVPPYAWLLGGAGVVGIVAAIAVSVGGPTSTAPTAPPSAVPAAVLPPQGPASASPTAPASIAPVAPASAEQPAAPAKRVPVKLTASPLSAKAYVDGVPIQLPTSIEVQEGKPVSVEIRADGFVSQLIRLDGTEPERSVKLAKETTRPASSKAGPSHDPTIRDPWANRNKK